MRKASLKTPDLVLWRLKGTWVQMKMPQCRWEKRRAMGQKMGVMTWFALSDETMPAGSLKVSRLGTHLLEWP